MKKISIKKTLCATAAAVMMMASVTGCGKEEEKTTATTAETTVEAGTASDATDTTEAGTGDVAASEMELPDKFVYDGKFEVQIVGYEYLDSGEDYEYDFLNVYFDLTPLDDRLRNVKTIYWTATQSGTELDLDPNSSLTYDDAEHTSDIWLCIQQGVTFRSKEIHLLLPLESVKRTESMNTLMLILNGICLIFVMKSLSLPKLMLLLTVLEICLNLRERIMMLNMI